MTEQPIEIEKPWCTYSFGLGLSGFGKIVRDEKIFVNIKYSEGQMYPSSAWNPAYVIRFDTLDEAVEYLRDNGVNIELIRNNSQGREQTGRQFFFSSSDWKAPWEPEGPKPNWKVGPPKNPSLN